MSARRLTCVGLVTLCCLFLAAGVAAQEDQEKKITRKEVPAPVLAAFAKAFPKAQAVGFAQEKEDGKTVYEVESKEGTVHRDVTFFADGNLVVVEESLPAADLPAAVKATASKESPQGTIHLAEKLLRGKTIEYELHMKEGKKSFELVIDPSGKLIKREGK